MCISLTTGNSNPKPISSAPSSNSRGNSFQNISEGGHVVFNDGWIYYTNPEDDYKIYRAKEDFSDKQRLTDEGAFYLNLIDNYLYFAHSKGDRYLCRIQLDGSDFSVVNAVPTYEPKLVGDWIYYNDISDDYALYRVKTDGSDNMLVLPYKAYYCCYTDDSIFSLNVDDEYRMYKAALDGSGNELFYSEKCECMDYKDGTIYFTLRSEGGIYSFDASDSSRNINTICQLHNTSINVYDGWIYFSNLGDNDKLYKIKIDGSSLTKLSGRPCRFINVEHDRVYYRSIADDNNVNYSVSITGNDEYMVN